MGALIETWTACPRSQQGWPCWHRSECFSSCGTVGVQALGRVRPLRTEKLFAHSQAGPNPASSATPDGWLYWLGAVHRFLRRTCIYRTRFSMECSQDDIQDALELTLHVFFPPVFRNVSDVKSSNDKPSGIGFFSKGKNEIDVSWQELSERFPPPPSVYILCGEFYRKMGYTKLSISWQVVTFCA